MSDVITPGSLLIKHMLPTEAAQKAYDPTRHLNSKEVENLVVNLLKNGGDGAYETINKLGQLFFTKAYEHGYSTPLSDYINDSEERTALIKEFEYKANQLLKDKNLGIAERANHLAALAGEYGERVKTQNINYMVSKGSTAAHMALTGARGNPAQLQQGTSTPLMGSGISGSIIPLPIRHSYAEGMSAGEQMALSYGGRSNTISAQTSTSLPGSIFKRIAPTVFHEVITIPDCHTTNGVTFKIEDSQAILGRVEAGTNKVINDSYYRELKTSNKKSVKVRSTLTCEARDGLCQKCFGLMANGHLPEIGENVGVIAAQSASENLTQAVLGTKHTGGTAGKKRDTFSVISNILKNPENFQDEATVAPENGMIADIQKTSLNHHEIYLRGESGKITKLFVPRQQDVSVTKNQLVRAGEAISTGTVNPRHVAAIKGVGAAQHYLSEALRDAYERKLDPRHFDILAKNLAKHVEILNPGNSHFVPGEKVGVKEIQAYLEPMAEEVDTHKGLGKVLAHPAGFMSAGTRLTKNHVEDLGAQGVSKVHIVDTPLEVKGIVPGLEQGKLLDPNWISRMAFNRIKSTISEAVAMGHSSNIHSTDPLTGYVMGNEFGQGSGGMY